MPLCRRCQAPIVFAKQKIWSPTLSRYMLKNAGKLMPIDAAPSDDGDIVLDLGAYILTKTQDERDAMIAEGRATKFHKSHFATCPFAEEFREQKKHESKKETIKKINAATWGG